jgi:hypothetical protein
MRNLSFQVVGIRRSAALFILALGQASAAPLTLTLPDQVTTVSGACTDYQTRLTTGVTLPNGTAHPGAHPGACQFTDFVPWFYDNVSQDHKAWRDYLAEVRAWNATLQNVQYKFSSDPRWPYRIVPKGQKPWGSYTTSRPYTITGDVTPSWLRPNCLTVVDFDQQLSAKIQSFRLSWDPMGGFVGKDACAKEWQRVDPSLSKQGMTMATANQIVQGERDQLKVFFANRRFCGADRKEAEARLAAAVEFWTARTATTLLAQWDSMRPTFDGPGTGAANTCAIHCNQCDFPGWAGNIHCAKTLTNGIYHMGGPSCVSHTGLPDETQDWYVGGVPTIAGGMTIYPSDWTATGSWCNGGFTVDKVLPINIVVSYSAGAPTFASQQYDDQRGYVDAPSVDFNLYTIYPNIQGTVNAMSVSGTLPPTAFTPGDAPTVPGLMGTVTCTWHLYKR